jgi:hypothetical protein
MRIIELVLVTASCSLPPKSSLLAYYNMQAGQIVFVQPACEEGQTHHPFPLVLEHSFLPVVVPASAGQEKTPTRSDWGKTATLSLQHLKFCCYRGRSDITSKAMFEIN